MRRDYHTNPIEVCETGYALICRMMSAYVYHYLKQLVAGMVNHCKLGPTSSYLEIREPMKEVLLWFGNPNIDKNNREIGLPKAKNMFEGICVFLFYAFYILHLVAFSRLM